MNRNILCVDDSISTTPESTIEALNTLGAGNVHLFFGGLDRGLNYKKLAFHLKKDTVKAVYFFGSVGQKLHLEIQKTSQVPVFYSPTLQQSIDTAMANLVNGDTLLLSPGASSFDEFTNFKERGDYFVEKCKFFTEHSTNKL